MKRISPLIDILVFTSLCFVFDNLLFSFTERFREELALSQSIYHSLITYRATSVIACVAASVLVMLFTRKGVKFCAVGILFYTISYLASISIFLTFLETRLLFLFGLFAAHLLFALLAICIVFLLSKTNIPTFDITRNLLVKIFARAVYAVLLLICLYRLLSFSYDIYKYVIFIGSN